MAAKCSSYEVKPFTDEETKIVKNRVTRDIHSWVHVGEKGYVLPQHFLTHGDAVRYLPLRHDDIFVVTYPRSGTTWTQELVWLLANDLDFQKAKSTPLQERYPFLEYYMFFLPQMLGTMLDDPVKKQVWDTASTPAPKVLEATQGQRFVKTHLPLSLLPTNLLSTCKVVYVARNVKDVAVSCYHFYKANQLLGINGDFKTFYEEYFAKDLCPWSPFFEHIKEGWRVREHPNMFFILYEDLSKDLKSTARRVADFLGKSYTDQQLDELCEHLDIVNFKKNAAVDAEDLKLLGILEDGKLVRKGKSGGWRDHFDEEMIQHADSWARRELAGTGLTFSQ